MMKTRCKGSALTSVVVRGLPVLDNTTLFNFSSSHLSIVSGTGVSRNSRQTPRHTFRFVVACIRVQIPLLDLTADVEVVAEFASATPPSCQFAILKRANMPL